MTYWQWQQCLLKLEAFSNILLGYLLADNKTYHAHLKRSYFYDLNAAIIPLKPFDLLSINI